MKPDRNHSGSPATPKLPKPILVVLTTFFLVLAFITASVILGAESSDFSLSATNSYDEVIGFQREPLLIEIVESEYTLRIAAEQAERQRMAQTFVRQGANVPPRADLTLNLPSSGSAYGTAKLLYRDTLYRNCVSFVKAKTGIYRPLGNGARGAIQGYEPRVGAIGSTRGLPHAVYVVAVNGDMVTVHEANYMRGWITERVLPTSQFVGFIYN